MTGKHEGDEDRKKAGEAGPNFQIFQINQIMRKKTAMELRGQLRSPMEFGNEETNLYDYYL